MSETEKISLRYQGIDIWPDPEIAQTLWEGQIGAIASVRGALNAIARAAQAISSQLLQFSGRLVYVGAGSAGLLAMQEGMEMNPTFGWPLNRTLFLMAGGDGARLSPSGHHEDDGISGHEKIISEKILGDDVVIGVSASGNTNYTVAATESAARHNNLTIGISNNRTGKLLEIVDHPIFLDSGCEVIAGSTRMNAGTAQKAALNILSSMTMIHMGHVVDGMMVNLTVDNKKLHERATTIVSRISNIDGDHASDLLESVNGSVKAAVLLAMGLNSEDAVTLLKKHHGFLRKAMGEISNSSTYKKRL